MICAASSVCLLQQGKPMARPVRKMAIVSMPTVTIASANLARKTAIVAGRVLASMAVVPMPNASEKIALITKIVWGASVSKSVVAKFARKIATAPRLVLRVT
jgi:hypothetical protein